MYLLAACRSIKCKTRSIVVTSGTLTPMDTYAGELDVDFGVVLEVGGRVGRGEGEEG